MLFIVICFIVCWPRFLLNLQATFPLISPKVFGILTPNFTTNVRKMWQTFDTKIRMGLKKKWGGGDDVVDHVKHF